MAANKKDCPLKHRLQAFPFVKIGDCFHLNQSKAQGNIRRKLTFISLIIFSVFLLTGTASGEEGQEEETADIVSLTNLSFDLDDYIGKKVWIQGFYGDERFTGDGVGFLVDKFYHLLVDEQLTPHSYIRIDGELPPYSMNGAEIYVYGEVNDFAATYNKFTLFPTPLITVEKYEVITPPESAKDINTLTSDIFSNDNSEDVSTDEGTQASGCDRALIISGGADDNNNHARYTENVQIKYKRLRELGFTDDQITVLYNNGNDINDISDPNGTNIVDNSASKNNINNILDRYLNEMSASCTLAIFVTDHGTGYSESQGYHGARPAESNEPGGLTYPEDTFTVNLRRFVRVTCVLQNSIGHTWTYSGNLERAESISRTPDGYSLVNRYCIETSYRDYTWDTDGDGTGDTRVRWDGDVCVMERFKDGQWQEMGRDTNGDHIIDAADGGVDWNLDGDTHDENGRIDRVGFHEGINLWGNEVLWDYELAEKLEALSDKGIHIVIEMCQCFAGGFINNLTGKVEDIVTFSGEDTKHCNRVDPNGKIYAADEKAFVDNLNGIDIDSWNHAFDEAVEEDTRQWEAEGSDPESWNEHSKWDTPCFETESSFIEENGIYMITMMIPGDLVGQVYDMEIYYGLQKPRWQSAFILESPEGASIEEIGGGIYITSQEPFPPQVVLLVVPGIGTDFIRIDLTDKNHKKIGYIKVPRKIGDIIIALDDFESYISKSNDDENLVWLTWLDGFENPTNGSQVGYLEPPFMETEIIHNGRQSMPFYYGQTEEGEEPGTESIAERTFEPSLDWTPYDYLSLWIYGDPNNDVGGLFFVEINDQTVYTEVNLTEPSWQQVNINLGAFNTNIGEIYSMNIGVDGEASGLIFIDDIKAYNSQSPESSAFIIDGFEDYDNEFVYITWIWEIWSDGIGDPDNGSSVGDEEGFTETEIIHNGRQSMPFYFNNTEGVTESAAYRMIEYPRDWSEYETLSLWIHGDPNNIWDGQFFIQVNDTKMPVEADLTAPDWQELEIELETIDTDLTDVSIVGVGVGGNGSGIIYIDDISLSKPPTTELPPEVDFALRLGANTGRELKVECTEQEIENFLASIEGNYIEFMRYDLSIYIESTDPSVTPEMKQQAQQLMDYLDTATYDEQLFFATAYVNSLKAALQ